MPEYTYEVKQTAAGQWRFVVYEDGDEVQAGAGYETEDEADLEAWLAVAEWRGRLSTFDAL